MEKTWAEMTPEEKRAKRLEPYFNPTDIKFKSPKAAKQYRERTRRILKMYMNETPDRVPVSLPAGNFPLYYAGGDLKKGMYDYQFLRQAYSKFLQDFKDYADVMQSPGLIHSGKAMEMIGQKLLKWPGHGLKDNVNSYQFVEGEYMKADEYDHLLRDPSDFAFRIQIPRVYEVAKPFAKMQPYATLLGMTLGFASPFTDPEIQKAYQTLIDAGKEMTRWGQEIKAFSDEAVAEGFPSLRGGMAVAPFDCIGDSLRGTQGVILDMYRQPDKLLAAIDLITPIVIQQGIDNCNASGGVMVTFPLHKGDDTFMSDKQFEKFYWPSLKKYADALIAEGIMPVMFAEGRYARRLNYISDFPKGWVHWYFDQTDMAVAKKLVGKNCSISGNIPSSVMCTARPAEVKEYCRKLIETCAPGGGYMLTGGAGATETNAANLKVLMEAALEYGVY
ncbi:MAG TPA: uroporphyrinogen decarboxylase family protein [Dehalococcoidales bacterium]|nr:uroporphyrinogen decarboxylase family protein [Dehalococcoidales bacterium]